MCPARSISNKDANVAGAKSVKERVLEDMMSDHNGLEYQRKDLRFILQKKGPGG